MCLVESDPLNLPSYIALISAQRLCVSNLKTTNICPRRICERPCVMVQYYRTQLNFLEGGASSVTKC
jgi:hypothetical protein